jgi:23S rRNA (guanosine2251-2'-O)-methyltransferase
VVARAAAYRYADLHSLLETGAPLLVADQVHDPNNLGALARTAAAVGMGGIVLPERGAAGVTGAVEKAAAGAVNDLLICRVVNLVRALGELAEGGYWSIALVPQGGEDLFRLSLPEKPVLVLGGERGLRPLVQRKCDLQATIPVPGPIESLNASVAGAIAMYELFRRQKLG